MIIQHSLNQLHDKIGDKLSKLFILLCC